MEARQRSFLVLRNQAAAHVSLGEKPSLLDAGPVRTRKMAQVACHYGLSIRWSALAQEGQAPLAAPRNG